MNLMKGPSKPKPPHLIVDNWYSPDEEKRIWTELDFYSHKNKFERAETEHIAKDENGKYLGEHFRVHLDNLYTDEARKLNISDIFNCFSKTQTPKFREAIKSCCSPYFQRTFSQIDTFYSLVSYYENNDYYKPHHDIFSWTILIWFFREPKAFTGGDLIFPEFNNYRVECKHNRLIAFPSYNLHGVETINIPKEKRGKGFGRYTITHFLHCKKI